jgi:hypothetical protein
LRSCFKTLKLRFFFKFINQIFSTIVFEIYFFYLLTFFSIFFTEFSKFFKYFFLFALVAVFTKTLKFHNNPINCWILVACLRSARLWAADSLAVVLYSRCVSSILFMLYSFFFLLRFWFFHWNIKIHKSLSVASALLSIFFLFSLQLLEGKMKWKVFLLQCLCIDVNHLKDSRFFLSSSPHVKHFVAFSKNIERIWWRRGNEKREIWTCE